MFHVKHCAAQVDRARAALFSLGVLCAFSELLVLRETLFLVGGTELALGVMLATWLLAGAAGSLAGGRAGRTRTLSVLLGACAIILPAQVFSMRLVRGALAGGAGELPGVSGLLWLCCLIGAPLPALLGAIFPIAARMLGPHGAARAYIIETGALALGGGLTLVLVALRQEHLAVALVCALFALGAGAAARHRAVAALAAFIPLVLAASGAWGALEQASISFAFRQERVIATVCTPHGRAFAASRGGVTHIYSGGLSQTPLAAANETLELTLALVGRGHRVLVLADDPEGYVRTLATFEHTRGTLLVPDPDLLAFRRALRPFPMPPNVQILARGALWHLRGERQGFGAIILSVGPPLTARNNRFYTLRFLRLLSKRLAPGGVVALELPYVPGHVSGDLAALVGSIWATLGQAFTARRVALAQHAGTILLLAGNEPEVLMRAPAPSPGRQQAREKLGLHAPVDFEAAFSSTRVALTADMLDAGDWPPNTVLAPVSYQRAIAHSQRRFGPPGVLSWLWGLRWWQWLLALAALAAPFVILSARAHPDAGACSGAAGGGLCAMIAQVAIIHIFQSAWGLLYSLVGLLVGAFMLGALSGAIWSRKRRSPVLALGLLCGLSLYLGALPWLLSAAASANASVSRHLLFPALSFAAGLLTGALFPACANVAGARSAGRLYAADLAGASAGALLCGLVFMPALGLHKTALLACCGGLLLALPLLVSIIRFKAGVIPPQRRRGGAENNIYGKK